ncbi:ParD-like family protein [Brevundimonas albigilva]
MHHMQIIEVRRRMGIVNIEDELHEQLRRASKASCRSINGQAAYWIRLGMLAELNPGLSVQELTARELKAAGVETPGLAA